MKALVILLATLWSSHLLAETPQQVLDLLQRDAGISAVVTRGEHLYRMKTNHGETPSCTSCHTDSPKAAGKHVRTHKPIEALAPSTNPARFTDPAKVEKWFARNCRDVLNRACTPQEKADFAAYMLSVK